MAFSKETELRSFKEADIPPYHIFDETTGQIIPPIKKKKKEKITHVKDINAFASQLVMEELEKMNKIEQKPATKRIFRLIPVFGRF